MNIRISNMQHASFSKSSGYSLLELSIVIIIIGLLIMAISGVTIAYNKFERNEKAKGTITIAKTALDNFYADQKRYPCPSNPALAPTDPNFGMEDCGLAVVAGARTMTPPNPILVGTFPKFAMTKELGTGIRKPIALSEFINPGISQNKPFIDPWDHQMTYAVTTQLIGKADGTPKDDREDGERGNIAIVDEDNENTGGTNGNADYVIVAHGKNGLGARDIRNTLVTTCDTAYTQESENCDADSRFVQGISNLNEANKATYFDDYVTYTRVVNTDIWAKRDDDDTIYNTNLNGDIGIKTTNKIDDDIKLQINGTIEASDIISAELICDASGGNCFAPESLYNIQCASGQVLKQVQVSGGGFSPRCENIEVLSNGGGCSQTCPGYQVIQGFNSAGCPVCSLPQ